MLEKHFTKKMEDLVLLSRNGSGVVFVKVVKIRAALLQPCNLLIGQLQLGESVICAPPLLKLRIRNASAVGIDGFDRQIQLCRRKVIAQLLEREEKEEERREKGKKKVTSTICPNSHRPMVPLLSLSYLLKIRWDWGTWTCAIFFLLFFLLFFFQVFFAVST
jgi:hypothetical protein